MSTYFYEATGKNPWENLAVETHLAEQIQSGDFILYLWQNQHTVVIGRNQNALRECRAGLLESEGGCLARRTTGGGAVYQDLGNLCFTFLASPERYDLARQMKVIAAACLDFGIETECSGRNDIVTREGCKFSGNAFSNTGKCRIQHGTLMIDVDKARLARYLTPSEEKMKAKGVKSVESRVCNLKDLNPEVTVEGMKNALRKAFRQEYGEVQEICAAAGDPGAGDFAGSKANATGRKNDCGEGKQLNLQRVQEIYETYASWDWRYGKSPECETVVARRFDWGEVEIHLRLKNLYIEECKVYSDTLDVDFPGRLERFLKGKRYDLPEEKEPRPDECNLWPDRRIRDVRTLLSRNC